MQLKLYDVLSSTKSHLKKQKSFIGFQYCEGSYSSGLLHTKPLFIVPHSTAQIPPLTFSASPHFSGGMMLFGSIQSGSQLWKSKSVVAPLPSRYGPSPSQTIRRLERFVIGARTVYKGRLRPLRSIALRSKRWSRPPRYNSSTTTKL